MAKAEREQEKLMKQAEREDLRSLPDAFKLNLQGNPDRFYEIIKGTYRPPKLPGESDKITKSIDANQWASASGKRRSLKGREDDEDEDTGTEMVEPVRRTLGGAKPEPQYLSKYAKIVDRLERFPFSDNEEKLAQQLGVVERAIRSGMYEILIQEVVKNTQQFFGSNFHKAYKAPGGVKIIFAFNNKKVSVVAQGNFYGDETIAVFAEGGELSAAVMKLADGMQEKLDDFNVTWEVL